MPYKVPVEKAEKDEKEKRTWIKKSERRELHNLFNYAIDSLMDAQERLLIEHPVGKKAGFWTV